MRLGATASSIGFRTSKNRSLFTEYLSMEGLRFLCIETRMAAQLPRCRAAVQAPSGALRCYRLEPTLAEVLAVAPDPSPASCAENETICFSVLYGRPETGIERPLTNSNGV